MVDNKALGRLLASKRMLTRQQYKTIKGQILAGDAEGAMRGLEKILNHSTQKKPKKLKVLELFAGTRSIGKAFEEADHEVISIDWDHSFQNIDWYADIGKITAQDILERFGRPDVIWASPDCTTFSIAAISHHRTKGEDGLLYPKSEYAKQCDEIDKNVMRLIEELHPKYWFVENPRCGMRKSVFMQPYNKYRHTVTYCQYGDTRMKPTDIWTNHPDPKFKPMCKNGDTCHVSAPRGARTGTQGLRGSKERSIIPKMLCEHIVDICEGGNVNVLHR